MGIGRAIGGIAAAGVGAVGLGLSGIAGEDNTSRDDSGAIVEEGELGAFRIKLGDCIGDFASGLVESVQGVPCEGPHMYEVYYAVNLPDGDYPGDYSVERQADEACYDQFAPFVGTSYEDSIYGFTYLYPTKDSWEQIDDREVLCLVGDYEGNEITGSVEGSGL